VLVLTTNLLCLIFLLEVPFEVVFNVHLTVWPMKLGTNLKPTEILALEAAGFQLPLKKPVSPRRLFSSAPPPPNLSAVPVPAEPDRYPGKRDGKIVKRIATRPNPAQQLSMASSDSLKACIRSINMISHP
jgi:hypothetical protein